MIIRGLPIQASKPLRSLVSFLKDAYHFRRREGQQNVGFVFVYFSYEPDYEFLLMSLKSLVRADCSTKSVYLFVDAKAPFANSQITTLTDTYPNLIVRSIDNFSWASAESTLAEINAFRSVTEDGVEDTDFLVKVDSDILFLSRSQKFSKISRCSMPVVGDSRFTRGYMQGGLYFIRVSALKAHVLDASLEEIQQIEDKFNKSGEDLVITELLRSGGVEPYFTSLMLFRHDYLSLRFTTKLTRQHFCAAHFIKDKERMTKYFDEYSR